MKKLLILLFPILLTTTALAQNADEYFHNGAQSFINADLQTAINQVEEGLSQYPNDAKLNALMQKLQEEQERQQQQQNQNQQQQQNQEQQEQNDQEQESQENQEQQDQEQQEQQNEEGESQGEQEPQEMNPEELESQQISKEDAEKILQALAQKKKNCSKNLKRRKLMEAPSMIKIGRLHTLLSFFVAAFVFGTSALAQDVEVNASLSETNIFAGEQVQLEISISGTSMGSVQQPELPEIDGLRWIRGSTQRGTSYTIVNGTPSVTYSFGYVLIAQDPGEYTVPSITVDVGGQSFETAPISFKILDPETIDSGEADRAPDIYVRLEPSAMEPVVGQQVVADIVLYFKSGIEVSSYQPSQGWKAEGFWKEELQYPQRAQTTSTIINGTRYNRAGLLQYAIFPTKSGELTISPFEISIAVRQQRSSREPFGFGLGQERMALETQPVTLNVRQLPEIDNATFWARLGILTSRVKLT